MAVIGVLCLLVSESSTSLPGQEQTRGRVHMAAPAVLTDWGTPLRGFCWGLDRSSALFTKAQLASIKECGLNAAHVYTELTTTSSTKPIGYNAALMDSIVEWCRQESLYVVMTHGGPILQSSMQKILDVWKFYAPRYADQTHVIYEIKNEGCYETYHCAEPAMQMYRDAYRIIRESAPETHVMLMSHSNLAGGTPSLIEDVARLGPDIDWTNASFAFHGYAGGGGAGGSGDFQEQVIKDISDSGYCMTCTEFPAKLGLEKFYERAGISYCHFSPCYPPLTSVCGVVKGLGLSYAPDFGSWPQQHVEHVTVGVLDGLLLPSNGRRAGAGSRVLFGGAMRGGDETVYDIRGRLVWHPDPAQQSQSVTIHSPPRRLGTSMFLVRERPTDR